MANISRISQLWREERELRGSQVRKKQVESGLISEVVKEAEEGRWSKFQK